MPYYHVYIIKIENGRKKYFLPYNLSEKKLIENVVKPYMENKSFVIAGRVYEPSAIDKITIFKSNKNYRDLILPNGKNPVGQKKSHVARLFLRKSVAGVSICTDQFITSPPKNKLITAPEPNDSKRNVFIVHGKDQKAVKELKAMLTAFDLHPIILHEQPSGSRTIVEKLEKYSNVNFAFVILTPDDVGGASKEYSDILQEASSVINKSLQGKAKSSESAIMLTKSIKRMRYLMRERARQNVVLEFGYFVGKIGRDKVCCLLKGDVERPSDMDGIVYVPFEKSVNEARETIAQELRAAGYEIR